MSLEDFANYASVPASTILCELKADSKTFVIINYTELPADKAGRNLYCYGPDGNLVWISEARHDWSSLNPFVAIMCWEDGSLHAVTFSGLHYIVDPATGKMRKDQEYR